MDTADRRQDTSAATAKVYHIDRPVLRAKKGYWRVKRVLDFGFALIGIVLLLIPMCILALLIWLDSPGSPVFCQERLGKDGKPFTLYKFRSMRLDAEADGPRWAEINDSRCTRFGRILRRTRLDELPQLFNILKGDMSFVGPRPERAYFYERFESYIIGFSNRMMVMPGLTGYAQVNGGYDLKPEEKIQYDMQYIENQSFCLDVQCMLKTTVLLFTHHGAR